MGFLIPLITSLFTGITTFLAQYLTKLVAQKAAGVVLFLSLTSAFLLSMKAIVTGLAMAVPPEMALAIGWFMPSNFLVCVSAYASASVATWVYTQKTRIIKRWSQ